MPIFGQYIKTRREELGLGLRELAGNAGIDPSNYSKVERGVLAAPNDVAALKRLAKALDLPTDFDNHEWRHFNDMADASRGVVPDELLKEQRIVELLPALYQQLRDHQLRDGEDELDVAADIIKKVL